MKKPGGNNRNILSQIDKKQSEFPTDQLNNVIYTHIISRLLHFQAFSFIVLANNLKSIITNRKTNEQIEKTSEQMSTLTK